MKIFVTRHGQDDESVRGGWSDSGLTEVGIKQSEQLANELYANIAKFNIGLVVTSDLLRATQTADIVAEKLKTTIIPESGFREANNGLLAGMDNKVAEKMYPGLYWRKLDWNEHYPEGESPKEFYERVRNTWFAFKKTLIDYDKNVLLVTHGGVINIIRCISDGSEFSNKTIYPKTPNAKIILEIEV